MSNETQTDKVKRGIFHGQEGIRLLTVAIIFLLIGAIVSSVAVKIANDNAASASSNAVTQAQEIKASNICRDHPEEPLCTNAQKIIDNPTSVVQGPAGQPGTNGINGIDGATGSPGPTGPAGKDGINGTDGLTGLPGLTGLTGLTGLQGIQGEPGPTGANGISVTGVSCDATNNWTISFSSGGTQSVAGPCRIVTPDPIPVP